jgi:hypothetical protein
VDCAFINCSIHHTQKLCIDGRLLPAHRARNNQSENAIAMLKFYWAFATLEATLTGINTSQKKPRWLHERGF